MTCHLKLGERCFCMCQRPHGLDETAFINEVPVLCEHEAAADAVALVHLLQDFKLFARIVDGLCEWNPSHRDFRTLRKVRV